MKNLKIYLPVLGLIALGGSSTSFLSLDSSSRLFDSLISKGSVNNLFVNIFGSRKNQQIRVKVENVQKTDVNSVGSLETPETVNVNKEDLSLPLNEMEEERQEESIESVQGIFTEIKREEEADSIKGEYEKNLKTSKEKLTESSQDFKDATISLVRFSSESPTLKEIKKKKNIETNTSERFSLDKQKEKH
ncbi:hypothetical protein [Mycoplasma suis]|uniref:Uncharacterized protein n=1 Tax=Mycoplasma suis (strain Illinois) TaxID=768700 RepID=F0QRM4_MYCSL|nr:hypothetical protein [Mycoplasma suis]ADX98144.1 hypothetical protein MSU_0612 [Mycoplasma suis str. Illinois]